MDQTASTEHRDLTTNRSPITAISTFAASRWPLTLGFWLVVGSIGLVAYFGGLAREGFPPIDVPVAVVDGTYFVDDPATVDRDVALPLSEAFASVTGVEDIQSFAQANSFAVVVTFESGYTSPEGAAALDAVLQSADLPSEANPEVRSIEAAKFLNVYDVMVSITGPDGVTVEDFETQAATLASFLEATDAVDRAEVRNLLTEAVNPSTGTSEIRQTRFSRVAPDSATGYRDAIAIGLIRNPDADLDILGFSDEINSQLIDSSPLDPGYAAAVTADFATDIRSQISNLTGNLLTGLLAVAFVSLLLIGWRASIVTAGFMATVMMASLGGLWIVGYSLNTITLFGLILTLGLLVDDAIVISESIDANRHESVDSLSIIRTAINRVGSASFAGTLTTVLVFAPMLFVSGVLGEFIRAIPATVILTLLLSFLFSIVFIPAIGKPFLLRGKPSNNAVIRAERSMARGLGRLAEFPSSHGFMGFLVGLALVLGAVGMVFGSFRIAAGVGFNIFPPGKDANALSLSVDFEPGTTIETAETLATEIDTIIVDALGADLLRSQYVQGNERGILTFVDLVPFTDRETTAPTYVDQIESELAAFEERTGVRTTIGMLENGPPVDEFPFAVQILVDDETVASAEALAEDMRAALVGLELDKSSGEATTIDDALVSTTGRVVRVDGQRQIEVRAAFSTDDLTNNLDTAEAFVTDRFDASELAARGLDADALTFDYGQESENQEDFASLQFALVIAMGLMFLLLVIQFRSIVQPLLIFLAIPFSFFGVFTMLSLTDNPISFFVAVGFIALIGVVVNNTILLIDAANQGRRDGLRPGEAISRAVVRRFRPLVATTITTVVGLLPLALSDPFWEALSFTLIGGLVSSTILVLIAFPMFYLAVEKVRTPVRNAARRRMGRPLI